MRNLIVCADGTWNTPDQEDGGIPSPTNVVKLYNCLAEVDDAGDEQLRYYHPGVGSEGNWWDKVKGGSVGVGLSKNIMSAYRWLGSNYGEGDRLFLFGFSRGAYTVRSLAGMIARCGLLDLSGLPDPEVWARVEKAYKAGYRKKEARSKWAMNWDFHGGRAADGHMDIHFIGVWDTVGAMGIPDDMALLNLFDDRKAYAFHDTKLGVKVINARHAVALDEERASFSPTLWMGSENKINVKQQWFAGVHADVGGGYANTGLSDIALKWMIDEAEAKGLDFNSAMLEQINPDIHGILHDSNNGVFKLLKSQPRNAPKVIKSNKNIHVSAADRSSNPPISQAPYRPTQLLRKGQSVTVSIYADQPWNQTNLYLEGGAKYEFSAEGEWLDSSIKCGADGTEDGKFDAGEVIHLLGTALGKVEELFQAVSGNEGAEIPGTRRYEDYPWFSLVGVVADAPNPGSAGRQSKHTSVLIGTGTAKKVRKSGYLYCFANDAWNFYGNNRGSVRLTVKRV